MKPAELIVTSHVFEHEGNIPSKYTCEGENVNPPLTVENIPEGTKTLAIIMEDPDTSKGTFDHWLAWNFPIDNNVEEDRIHGMSGTNGAGKTGYHGPCPPSGSHRYFFYVYALDTSLDLPVGASKTELQDAMRSHILAEGMLMGRYEKIKQPA